MTIPTSQPGRRTAVLPGVVVVCTVVLLGGCVATSCYDAYGNPIAPAVVASVPVAAYPSYPYDLYYYYGLVYYLVPMYPAPVLGNVWIGGGDYWSYYRGRGGRE